MFAPREEKNELFAILLKKTEELGRQVTTSDFREDPTLPDPNNYAFSFGRFERAAEQAYREVHSKELPRKVVLKKPIKPVKKMPYQEIDHTHHFGRPPV